MDIRSASSLCHLLAHLLIKKSSDLMSCLIFQIASVAHRYRCALRISYAENKHIHALLLGILSSILSTTLMVFAICNDYYSSAYFFLLCETRSGQIYSLCDIGSLCSN